jgi:hypothetical protein
MFIPFYESIQSKLPYKHKEPINFKQPRNLLDITSLNIPLDEEDGDG